MHKNNSDAFKMSKPAAVLMIIFFCFLAAITVFLYSVRIFGKTAVQEQEPIVCSEVCPDEEKEELSDSSSILEMPPLDSPVLIFPSEGSTVRILGNRLVFRWKPVPNADYYQFQLYAGNHAAGVPLCEENIYNQTQFSVCDKTLSAGSYSWIVRAYKNETPSAESRTNSASCACFSLRELHPVALVLPEDGTVFDGISAQMHPAFVQWESFEPFVRAELIIAQSPEILQSFCDNKLSLSANNITYCAAVSGSQAQLPPLAAGTYWWTISAFASDGFDISARNVCSFTVDVVPPFSAPLQLKPENGTVFDSAYLVQTRRADLLWASVSGADSYELSIFRETDHGNENVLNAVVPQNDDFPHFPIDDLAFLAEGSFIWTVSARCCREDGVVCCSGEKAESGFRISLPIVPHFTLDDPGELYGN